MTTASNRLKTTTDITAEQELTFNTHKGEVLVNRKEIIKRYRVTSAVDKQCRHPVDARSSEELAEIFSVHDHWADNLTVEADSGPSWRACEGYSERCPDGGQQEPFQAFS